MTFASQRRPGRPSIVSNSVAVIAFLSWASAASAENWYYISFSAAARATEQQCVALPAGMTPDKSLTQHVGNDVEVVLDKINADQSRVLVYSSRTGSRYAYTTTVKSCTAFRASIVAEVDRKRRSDATQWYVAQLTHGDCISMREMFGALGSAKTPEELHRQMTKDGTSMSLERRGESVRLLSFDGRAVPPLHLVKGEAACEDYVKR